MQRPLSILVPHFDKKPALRTIHEELKIQIEPTDEVIVVDDFTPDGIPDLGCKCTRIINPPNKLIPHIYRLNTLRNLGVASANHDCCIILDPDCLPNPNFLANARRIFDPSILFAGRIDYFQKDGSVTIDPRTTKKRSNWIDTFEGHGTGVMVWGGIMMFSKAKVDLFGGFDTDFDGKWGAEEHEFASRCFNSGMRLFYSTEISVTHLYHVPNRPGLGDNTPLWQRKAANNRKNLNVITPYRPNIGVCIITMLRPDLIDQCLRGIFRNIIPVRVRLCVNGDDGVPTREALRPWQDKWAVEIVKEKERVSPSKIRNDAMKWAVEKGYKFLLSVDDDITVSASGITNLVRAMEKDPNIHACAGYLRDRKGKDIMLGGSLLDNRFNYLYMKPGVHSTSWVGSGFTLHRLDPPTFYDEKCEMGYEDYDWSMEAVKAGRSLAVCGDAGAYHGMTFTEKGVVPYNNPPEYNRIRYDDARHERMANKFTDKWGFSPRYGMVQDK